MKVAALAFLVSLFVFQPACDRGAAPTEAAANGPAIKLLEGGKGPKKALRFTAQKGMKKVLMMSTDMAMTMNLGGAPNTQKIPTMKMPLELTVVDASANGDFRYDFTLLEPEVVADDTTQPAVVEAIKTAIAGMKGMGGTAVITSRGFTKEVDIKMPPGANPQIAQFVDSLKQSIGQMAAPLPAEEVGVGAKWETTTKIAQNGVKLVQVATTELVALEGNVMTLKLSLNQTAAPQKITANGMTVELESYKGSGSGDSTLDLTQIVPTQAKVVMKSDMNMKAGGQTMAMGLDLGVTMTSK